MSTWGISLLPVLVAMIAALPGMIMALLAWRSSLRNNAKINEVSVNIDGRLSQLLKLTAASSHTDGMVDQAATSDPSKVDPKPKPEPVR